MDSVTIVNDIWVALSDGLYPSFLDTLTLVMCGIVAAWVVRNFFNVFRHGSF